MLFRSKPVRKEFFEPHLGIYVEVAVSPVFDNKGKIAGSVHIRKNITDRKKAEEEREKLQIQLVQQGRLASLGELASGLAHEIGNPLQTVLGNVDLLLMDEQSEELSAIKNAAIHSREIIANLLDFARQKEMNFVKRNVNDLLEKTLSLYGKQLELQKIKVIKNYNDLPEIILSHSQIEQVFLNIIINAQKAMPKGGTLAITTRKIGDRSKDTTAICSSNSNLQSDFIEVSFKDTGIGIPEKNIKRLFEPFFTTRSQGVGLGLSVSHGIVKQHGGEILAFSEGERKGSEFVVRLPLKK